MGRKVADHLQEGFAALARGVAATRPSPWDVITLSVAPVFASKWLLRRLGDFSDKHPDIRVRIDATATQVAPVPGDVDAAIRVGRGGWSGVQAEEILPQRVFPVCTPSMAEHITQAADLTRVPIIRERNDDLFTWDTWLGPNGLSREALGPGPVYSDAALCLDAAAAGQGVFLALETLAQDAIRLGHLVPALPGRFPSGVSYWFVSPKSGRLPAQVKALRDWVFDTLE